MAFHLSETSSLSPDSSYHNAVDYGRQGSISGDPAAKYSSRSCSIKNLRRDRSAKKLFVLLSFERMILQASMAAENVYLDVPSAWLINYNGNDDKL